MPLRNNYHNAPEGARSKHVDLKIEEEILEVLIEEFIAELSPYLNGAEQMLFKVALCEEIFEPDEEDEI